MKHIGYSLLLVLLLTTPSAAQPATKPAAKPPATQAPATLQDQASYSIGFEFGLTLKAEEVAVNPALIARGLMDALTGAKPTLTEEQMQKALAEFEKIVKQQMQARAAKEGAKAGQEGAAFLAANAKKEGVEVLPSGLQYKVLKKGDATGPSPKATDTVRTHYHGTFIDGKVFDSSVQRNQPAEFPVGGVIKGWTEALQLMHVGDKWQLVIPPDLAYGEIGNQRIPPNATLVFEVELLEIKK